MDKRTLLKGWRTVVPIHILFVLIGILPFVNELKETTLYGFIINWAYQILLIVFIVVCLKDFLVDSWKRFASIGIKRNIKTILLCFLACVGINIVFQFLSFMGNVDIGASQNQSAIRTYISAYPLLTALLSIVVAPFTEECICTMEYAGNTSYGDNYINEVVYEKIQQKVTNMEKSLDLPQGVTFIFRSGGKKL